MEKLFCQADLSGWLSPDEERLLNLYRSMPRDERQTCLFRLSRQRYLPWFAAEYDPQWDATDDTCLIEELEDQLYLQAPWRLLGEFLGEEPHRTKLLRTAWGYAGPVLLGAAESDGLRADQLFNAAIRVWDSMGEGPWRRQPMDFSRRTALAFLEEWREDVMKQLFSSAT